MRIFLDPPILRAGMTFSALTQNNISARSMGGAIIICANKHPVALLTRRDRITRIFDLNGRELSLVDFDQAYPGKRAAFEAMKVDPEDVVS